MLHDLIQGDCRDLLAELADDSVDMILSDPPYYLDGLDNDWKKGDKIKPAANQVVKSLPVGMVFDRNQGYRLQEFMHGVALELIRAAKPGAVGIFFSQPRLSHRMAAGVEDAGFEIRDIPVWHFKHKSQFKAFSMNHFIKKLDVSENRKQELIQAMAGKRTLQLKPQIEHMILAQKPKQGTHVNNFQEYGTGLMNVGETAPSNLFHYEKEVKDDFNTHPTVKPVKLLCNLLELFSNPGDAVLDPFLGSGSTAVACEKTGRRCIGFEISREYMDIVGKRLADKDKGVFEE